MASHCSSVTAEFVPVNVHLHDAVHTKIFLWLEVNKCTCMWANTAKIDIYFATSCRSCCSQLQGRRQLTAWAEEWGNEIRWSVGLQCGLEVNNIACKK